MDEKQVNIKNFKFYDKTKLKEIEKLRRDKEIGGYIYIYIERERERGGREREGEREKEIVSERVSELVWRNKIDDDWFPCLMAYQLF